MDPPVRANAAQLAARKIKEKPKAKRSGSARPDHSAPQWASQSPQPGEGLFGGSVQASGSFNFSGPSSAPSFPPSSFGNGGSVFGGSNNGGFGGTSNGPPSNTSDQDSDRPVNDRPSKKQFGTSTTSTTQQNNNPFQMPTTFGQSPSTSTSLFGSANPSQGGNNIFFGGAPPSPAPSFGTTATTQSQPTNPFSFGTSSSQPPQSPSISFGADSAADKPASNPFNFSQTPSQPPQSPAPASSFFNQAPANSEPKPPSTPFSFGQTSKPPVSSGINFGSTPVAESPTKNLFGNPQPQPSAQPISLFGSNTTAQSPAKDLFGKSFSEPNTVDSPKPPMSNLFGSVQSAAPPVNDPFGNKAQAQSSTSGTSNFFAPNDQPKQAPLNIFGSSNQAPTAPPTFAEQKSQPASSIFDGPKPNQPSSNIFGGNTSQNAPVNNIFSSTSKPATSMSNIFGNLNKASDQHVVQSAQSNANANGVDKDRQASPEKPSASGDPFANLNKPLGEPATEPRINGGGTRTEPSPVKPAASVNGLFGNPFKQPEAQPAFLDQHQVTTSQELSSTQGQSIQQIDWAKVDWEQFQGVTMEPHKGQPKLRVLAQNVPFFKEPQSNLPYTPEVVSLIDSISRAETEQNFRAYELLSPAIPEKASSMTREEEGLIHDISGEARDFPKLFPGLYFAKSFPIEHMAPLVPEHYSPELRVEFYVAYRMKILNNELRKYFDTVSVTTNIIPAIAFYQIQRKQILRRGTAEYTMELRRLGIEPKLTQSNGKGSGKRAADDENQENEPPSKRTGQVGMSNAFQQSNEQLASASPRPTQAASFQPYLNGITATTSSAQLFQPPVPQPSATASPIKGKRKGDDLDQNMPQPKRNSPLKQVNMQNLNGASGGSNTLNTFKSILESPSKSNSPAKVSPERKIIGSPAKPADDAPRVNPFGKLPIPASPTATKTAFVSPGNMFAPKAPSSPTKAPAPRPAPVSSASANQFVPKPSSGNTTSSNAVTAFSSTPVATGQNTPAIKLPTFGRIDFQAQFNEQAAKNAEKREEELLQRAIDEELDSDDDEEEFRAKWKKERAETKEKEKKDVKSSIRFVPVAGKGSTFGASGPMFNTSTTPEKSPKKANVDSQPPVSLFSQKPSQSSSSSFFSPSPVNGSRASTPGAISNSGSVFDGHIAGQAPKYDKGIFSHLSDTGSGKDDDADEEDADEDNGGESDSENKDPNYQPGEESNSGPGTPASETGAGIASAKKPTHSFFGQSKPVEVTETDSNSGASTPGKSLEDRMTRPSSAGLSLADRITLPSSAALSPAASNEEKENTQPNASSLFPNIKSPFSALNTPVTGTAGDHTWNQGSPIKFGSSTPNGDTTNLAPTLSVTAATPTKSSSVFGSSLFGNAKDTKPPQSNIFGGITNSKPSVGFSFGASSTGPSLFPSAAPSASTSRATSPGATTDGDSGLEGDPDAEHHEQIDLTSSGPGEEDEEVLHEVRAKATHFVTKDGKGSWENRGVGPLRVLKNKDTEAVRMLLRGDPSGKILFNKGVLSNATYEAKGKTVKVMALAEKGDALETWVIQVKAPEFAEALAEVLEANKTSS